MVITTIPSYHLSINPTNVGITMINHPLLGMVTLATIYDDDWGMVYDCYTHTIVPSENVIVYRGPTSNTRRLSAGDDSVAILRAVLNVSSRSGVGTKWGARMKEWDLMGFHGIYIEGFERVE